MANEKWLDLISREDLIKAVQAKQFAIADNTHPYEAIRIQGKYFREAVENAPTVDAVEVVRCKDCKHWSDGVAGCTDHVKCCKIGFYMVGENGYCVYGERRTDG